MSTNRRLSSLEQQVEHMRVNARHHGHPQRAASHQHPTEDVVSLRQEVRRLTSMVVNLQKQLFTHHDKVPVNDVVEGVRQVRKLYVYRGTDKYGVPLHVIKDPAKREFEVHAQGLVLDEKELVP
jgi:hypothetical protein